MTYSELSLSIIFFIFLIASVNIPSYITNITSSGIGIATIACLSIYLFLNCHPLVAMLGFLVAFKLIKHSKIKSDDHGFSGEEQKWRAFAPSHQFKYTLEEEIVKNMTHSKYNTEYVRAPYKPTLEDTHDAAYLSDLVDQ